MKKFLIVVVALVIVIGGFVLLNQKAEKATIIEKDTTLSGPQVIEAGSQLMIKNGATLTVTGDLTVKGSISCDGGPLRIEVKGNLTVSDTIGCDRGAVSSGDPALGIALVVSGSAMFNKDSTLTSNGVIELVSRTDRLVTTSDQVQRLFDEVIKNTGTGPRVGPIIEGGSKVSLHVPQKDLQKSIARQVVRLSQPRPNPFSLIPIAEAQNQFGVTMSGKIVLKTPSPGVRQLVLVDVPDATHLTLEDLDLTGPDGRSGTEAKDTCQAVGGKGENAFRMFVQAPNLTVKNVQLHLGNGGQGGDATTKKDCDPGKAEGGKGGDPANFKMIGAESFAIEGEFVIYPGKGGAGGKATANGKDGGPSEKGGDADARGGDGGNNNKGLGVAGTIGGVENIQIGSVIGGGGGSGTANPGKGGDGNACGKKGGDGGKATARGAKGGDASLGSTSGAVRTADADDRGGKGGDATAHGGQAGSGGSCAVNQGPGGKGGKGGDVSETAGKGGAATTQGEDGTIQDQGGGNGGNGGDGCPPGKGGKGGSGKPPGKDGSDGKKICFIPEKKTGTSVNPPAGQTSGPGTSVVPSPTPTPTPPPTTPLTPSTPPSSGTNGGTRVIGYQGKYLPVNQLIVENEVGCGANHWHAAHGVVTATDGSMVYDPGPQCGFGKVSENPVMTLPASQ